MLSAHGSAPEVVVEARERDRVVVDAVCPLVTKVHHELKVRAGKGYTVLYVGHAGHEEAVGTMAVAPESVRLLEQEEDVDALPELGREAEQAPVALLAQTTLSHDEWAGIVERPASASPTSGCPTAATSASPPPTARRRSRPSPARPTPSSSSDRRTPRTPSPSRRWPRAIGCPRVLRVNDASELPDDLAGTVGVTAGASAPEALVEAVVERLAPSRGTEGVRVTLEEEYFPPPPELRELLRGLDTAVALLNLAPATSASPARAGALADDRSTSAADVLDALAG